MTAFVYILESLKTGRYYIGCTFDCKKRLKRHNDGYVPATKNFRPFKLVFEQQFSDVSAARSVESKLKRLKRKDYLQDIIKEGRIKASWAISSCGRAIDS